MDRPTMSKTGLLQYTQAPKRNRGASPGELIKPTLQQDACSLHICCAAKQVAVPRLCWIMYIVLFLDHAHIKPMIWPAEHSRANEPVPNTCFVFLGLLLAVWGRLSRVGESCYLSVFWLYCICLILRRPVPVTERFWHGRCCFYGRLLTGLGQLYSPSVVVTSFSTLTQPLAHAPHSIHGPRSPLIAPGLIRKLVSLCSKIKYGLFHRLWNLLALRSRTLDLPRFLTFTNPPGENAFHSWTILIPVASPVSILSVSRTLNCCLF